MKFEFATAQKILFGEGTYRELPSLVKSYGKKALVVSGYGAFPTDTLFTMLQGIGMDWEGLEVRGEPTTSLIEQGCLLAHNAQCDLVISLGGGSVLDTGKAIAILLKNSGPVTDYLEVVGKNLPLRNQGVPFIAIPTTAGTGSEVTRNAVLTHTESKFKVSLRSPMMLASAAIVDPELTYTLPPVVTASTGMDALAQVLEPFVSKRANPFIDLYCLEGMKRAARSIRTAYTEGSNVQARQDMAFTSLLGALALANAGLGAVHGFASPLGGMFNAPHGAICARLLPPVVEANVRALQNRAAGNPSLQKYEVVAKVLTNNMLATIADGVDWLTRLCSDLQIPGLTAYGVTRQDIPEIVDKAAVASSMQANPLPLTSEELTWILEQAL